MSRRQKLQQFTYDVRSERYWTFICFTPKALQQCVKMLAAMLPPRSVDDISVKAAEWRAGELFPAIDACCTILVPKTDLSHDALWPALRQHFGYENPDHDAVVFTLGIRTAQDDLLTALDNLYRPLS
jgi:hypothetical protein